MTKIEEAAQHLASARRERRILDRLPQSSRPGNDEEAFAVQRRVLELLGEKIGGWKASLPQERGSFLAPLPASTIVSAVPCPLVLMGDLVKIEPEIAFVIGRDLLPREEAYTEAEVRDAIAETHVVLELMGGRYSDPKALPFPEWLADSLNNEGLFIGPLVTNPIDRNLESLNVTITSPTGIVHTREGHHPNGHPIKPLVWLANFLSARGETLKAGNVVTTGSYAGVLEVPRNTPLTVEFGDVARLSVSFAAF